MHEDQDKAKKKLLLSFARLVARNPGILRQVIERIESDDVVDRHGRPVRLDEEPGPPHE